jgi:hypothetical protein
MINNLVLLMAYRFNLLLIGDGTPIAFSTVPINREMEVNIWKTKVFSGGSGLSFPSFFLSS